MAIDANNMLSRQVAEWLNTMPGAKPGSAEPVQCRIGNTPYVGAKYLTPEGDIALYLLGDSPKADKYNDRTVYVDGATYDEPSAWYIACWGPVDSNWKPLTNDEIAHDGRMCSYHPFGRSIILRLATIELLRKIDDNPYTPRPTVRIKFY